MLPAHLVRLFPALLLLISFLGAATQAQPLDAAQGEAIDFSQVDPTEHTYDHWYLDTIDGHPSGYWRSSLSVEDGKIISVYHEYRVESHGGEQSTYEHRVVWTETKDFKPISIVVTTAAGSDEVKKVYKFLHDAVDLTSSQNGRTIQRKLPSIKGDYLTAAQTSISTDLYLERGVDQFKLNILDITVGLTPYAMTYKRSANDKEVFKLADGCETEAQLWITTFAIFPGFEMKHWIDESRKIAGLAYNVESMTFTSVLADESVTERTFDPPEMSGLSVVVPDQPIKNIHRQRKIVYELSYDAGDADIVPVTAAVQSVEPLGKGKARVTVDLDAEPAATDQDQPSKAHLANSIMVDHEDAAVRELAKLAVSKQKKDADTVQIAKACKRYVTRHITGTSLSVGDGSASEAARTREGDCTECAVLLAAVLRANDIPSRCVSGLVYSEDDFVGQKDVFVYHMWTQAWIAKADGKGYWLDLDSAMWRYSAGHIALGVSAMGDEDQRDQIKVVPMQQSLTIKVIEIDHKD